MGDSWNSIIPETLSDCCVVNANGDEFTIGDLINQRVTLLLFVRHFGCIGCSESMGKITPRFKELNRLNVRILIIGCGASRFINGFMNRNRLYAEPVEVFTDDRLKAHQAAELYYGIWGGFGPRALIEMARAFVSGYVSGPVEGDFKQHAGAILVNSQGEVQLYHRNRSLGDHLNNQHLIDAALKLFITTQADTI